MSAPASSYRIHYPGTHVLTSVTLYDAAGSVLTPSSQGTIADDNGFFGIHVDFATPVEAVFATPVWQSPNAPVALYLGYVDTNDGIAKNVLDNTPWNSAAPGRPTPKNDASQYLLYTPTDLGGGLKSHTVKTPASPVAIVKDAGKDPITGANLDGNVIMLRWAGSVPSLIEVEADIEDITDPSGFNPVAFSNITTYAESSVGLSLIKSNTQIVPRDGLGHTVNFRLRYNVGGDAGPWATVNNAYLQFDLAAPNPPVSLTATLLRDRVDTIPDVVKLDWVKDTVSPGDGIEIYVTDYSGKKHSLYASNGPELTCRVENVSRFVVQDTAPAVARPYTFRIVSTNLSAKSDETVATPALNLTSKVKAMAPPTPDEVAGTAVTVSYANLKSQVFSDVLTALGALPAEGQAIVNSALDRLVLKLKDVVRLGGNVTLDNFGVIEAKWTNERLARNPSTGAPIVVPAYRSLGFTPSPGFKKGTRAGVMMTDAEAKLAV